MDEIKPAELEAGLSQDPGGSLHETEQACSRVRLLQSLRVDQIPQSGHAISMYKSPLGMSNSGEFSERGQGGMAREGVWVTVFRRVCSLRKGLEHLINLLLYHLAPVENRNGGVYQGPLTDPSQGIPKGNLPENPARRISHTHKQPIPSWVEL